MKIAFDCTLRRPGCAVVQAGVGGDLGIANRFDHSTWLVSLTPDMRLYEVDEEQLARLVQIADEAVR